MKNTNLKESESRKPVNIGDLIKVKITSLGKQGDGVAKIGDYGFIILVNGGIINKEYYVQITRILSTMAFARTLTEEEYEKLKVEVESQSQELKGNDTD